MHFASAGNCTPRAVDLLVLWFRKRVFEQPPSRLQSPTFAMPRAVIGASLYADKRRSRWQSPKHILLILAAVVACLVIFAQSRYWPFAEKVIIKELHQASDSQITVRSFHRTYFPYPGCVLEQAAFTRGIGGAQPLIYVEKLTIHSTYVGMLVRHIRLIEAEGLRIFIPPFGTGMPFHTQRSSFVVDKFVANNAVLEIGSRKGGNEPVRFDIHEATLSNVGGKTELSYRLKLHNPNPPGEISATGTFGPWNKADPKQTPASGQYKLEDADLSVYGGISGLTFSAGKFSGKLGQIEISGTTDTPAFEVESSGHWVELITQFSADVDATRGDTILERVDAHFGQTEVVTDGSIAKRKDGKGRAALIHLSSHDARIDDILGLFVKNDRPPMSGATTLDAKVEIPPGADPFLRRVKLKGNFGIGGGEFAKPTTQHEVNKLSAGARGEKNPSDPETVLTDLSGQVTLARGLAHFADLSFRVPGAAARMHGTYNIINHKIDLHGQMQVDSKISNTEKGAKALLMKIMEPFFKKKNRGEILPVRISGSFEKPSFGLDPMDKKAKVPEPSTEPGRPQ